MLRTLWQRMLTRIGYCTLLDTPLTFVAEHLPAPIRRALLCWHIAHYCDLGHHYTRTLEYISDDESNIVLQACSHHENVWFGRTYITLNGTFCKFLSRRGININVNGCTVASAQGGLVGLHVPTHAQPILHCGPLAINIELRDIGRVRVHKKSGRNIMLVPVPSEVEIVKFGTIEAAAAYCNANGITDLVNAACEAEKRLHPWELERVESQNAREH